MEQPALKRFDELYKFPDKEDWFRRYHDEVNSLEELGEVEVVKRPLEWDNILNEIKRKTMIVVQENCEVQSEAILSVASYDSLRLFVAVAAMRG